MVTSKTLILFLGIACFLTGIINAPIIPVESIETKTRIVKFQYDSEVFGDGYNPRIINVTNQETITGSFSVTANIWSIDPLSYLGIDPDPSPFPLNNQPKKELFTTDTQEMIIEPCSTETFFLPKNWIVVTPMYSFDYTVDAPLKQENYNVTKTEYKSILEIIA